MNWNAKDLIKQAIERHGDSIAVACSFGKDSIVALWMAIQIKPDIKVIFENTGVEYKQTIDLKNKLHKEWNLNLKETKPIKSFWQCVDDYGIPKCRKTGGKGSNSPKCCKFLKEEPAKILQREWGVNAVITGLQSCESRSRSLIAKRYDNKKAPYMEAEHKGEIIEFCSQRWFTKSTNCWSYHPIMHWSVKDVWEYIFKNNLPINKIYIKWDIYGNHKENPKFSINKDHRLCLDGVESLYQRCGCSTCTAYLEWEKSHKSHPRIYFKLKELADPNQQLLTTN